MSLTATITHTDGSTDTLDAIRTEEEYEFRKMDIASVYVDRPQVNEITLEENLDEVEIDDSGETLFGGVLRDVLRGGSEVELILDSYERYALDAERSGGGLTYDNVADTTIYSDAVSDIPQISEGTVENLSNAVTFVFSYTSPAKRIRTVAENVGSEVLYPPDKTIDIVGSLGSDKTTSNGGTPLSPAQQNISGDFNPERQSGDERITHLIMLGAGEGDAQIQATVVPDADPYDYEGSSKFQNVRRYTADNWSDGERKSWDSQSNKDITNEDTLGDLGVKLIEEYNAEFIDIEVTVEDQDVALGDEFTIQHPEENIDLDLRAVDVTRIVDSSGRRYNVTFSNRRLTRQTEQEKDIKDTERYNRAFEGTAVTMNTGGGRQPVNSQNNYEFSFYYPAEVEYEHRVKLFVKGLAYRAYSQGAAAGGDHSHEFNKNGELQHGHVYNANGELEHGHEISDSEFSHYHSLSTSADSHDHADGTYGADSHGHGDGTYDADSHGHSDGTFGADSHGHSDGTFGADSHGHDEGTYDADSHDHLVDIGTTSGDNADENNVEESSDDSSGFSSSSWVTLDNQYTGSHVSMMFVQLQVDSVTGEGQFPIDVRLKNGETGEYIPDSNGWSLISYEDRESSIWLVNATDTYGHYVDLEVDTGGGEIRGSTFWLGIGQHDHDVSIYGDSGFTGPAVLGDSGDTSPGVSGSSGDSAPGVSGSSGDTAPGVGGSSGSTAPGVGGSSGSSSPGVSGDTDSQGGVRTTDTKLGTQETTETELGTQETTDASGDHTHSAEPGIIEFSEYPSACDVIVNGTSLGMSLGDGSGTFEQEVDLAGNLNPGEINTVEISSDTLGHIQAHLDIDVYRQILGRG